MLDATRSAPNAVLPFHDAVMSPNLIENSDKRCKIGSRGCLVEDGNATPRDIRQKITIFAVHFLGTVGFSQV